MFRDEILYQMLNTNTAVAKVKCNYCNKQLHLQSCFSSLRFVAKVVCKALLRSCDGTEVEVWSLAGTLKYLDSFLL